MKKVVLQDIYVALNWKIKVNMNCLLLCVFILFAINAFPMKRKYIHTVDDNQYS